MYPLAVLRCNKFAVGDELKEFLAESFYGVRVINAHEIVMMGNNYLAANCRGKFRFYSRFCASGALYDRDIRLKRPAKRNLLNGGISTPKQQSCSVRSCE